MCAKRKFWRKTHTPLWLLIGRIIFLTREKKHHSRFWLDVSFFQCENHRLLLWLARTNLRTKIYDIAFWWVFLSMYITRMIYQWYSKTHPFTQDIIKYSNVIPILDSLFWMVSNDNAFGNSEFFPVWTMFLIEFSRSEVDPSSLSNENKYHYPGIQNMYKKGNVEF